MAYTFHVGQRVYWTDPDEGYMSGWAVITGIHTDDIIDDDTIIDIDMELGGSAGVLPFELSLTRSVRHGQETQQKDPEGHR